MDSYNDISFVNENSGELDLTACTTRNTDTLIELFGNIESKINNIIDDNIILLGREYFCPFDAQTGKMKKTKNTYGIHWYSASWRDGKINYREKILRPIKRIIGVENFDKIKRVIKK